IKIIDRAEGGNISGSEPDAELEALIAGLPDKAGTLLYLGDTARHQAKSAKAAVNLLKKAAADFTVLKDEPDCAAGLGDLIGYVDEVRQIAKKSFEAMAESGAKTIVVLDPSCASFMKRQCAEWGILPESEIVTATAYFANLIADGKLSPKKLGGKAAFHDPCRLSRDLDETEPARDIIKAMGIELNELFLNRKLTKCCSGPVLRETYPEISALMASARWADVGTAGVKRLITACPGCAAILGGSVPAGAEQFDLFALLDTACE
ncbi:MAG: (Fe-S)-binding protein, partial [Oscillospiraceae bacterium]